MFSFLESLRDQLGASLEHLELVPSRAEQEQEVVVLTHHKSGTVAAFNLVMALCCASRMEDRSHIDMWKRWFGSSENSRGTRCADECRRRGVRYLFNGFDSSNSNRRPPSNGTAVHFIRHPAAMIVSGYAYHRACSETWTTLPLTTDVNRVAPAQRVGWGIQMRERFGNALNVHRIRTILSAQPHEVLSYCALLRHARNSFVTGIEAEVVRSWGARDGVQRMLADFTYLHRPSLGFGGRVFDVCNDQISPSSPNFEATWVALVNNLHIPRERLPALLRSAHSGYRAHSRRGAANLTWQTQLAAAALMRHGGARFAHWSRAWPCAMLENSQRPDMHSPSEAPSRYKATERARSPSARSCDSSSCQRRPHDLSRIRIVRVWPRSGLPLNSSMPLSRLACAFVNIPGDKVRLVHALRELRAASGCSAIWHVTAITVKDAVFARALTGDHASHLRHFKPGVVAWMLTLNYTLSWLVNDPRVAGQDGIIIFQDDVFLHPRFSQLLSAAWRSRPAGSSIFQLGMEGWPGSSGACHTSTPSLERANTIGHALRVPTRTEASHFWQYGFGMGEPANAFTFDGARLWVRTFSARNWSRAPGFCDEVDPRRVELARHKGVELRTQQPCRLFVQPGFWLKHMIAMAQPTKVVHWAARVVWPLHLAKHRVKTNAGTLQCGLVVQGAFGTTMQKP